MKSAEWQSGLAALCTAEKAEQQGIGEWPGLAFIIDQVVNNQADLFHHFPADGIFHRLADFAITGHQCPAAVRPAGIACEEQPVAIRYRNDDCRGDFGVDNIATGAGESTLGFAVLH